MLSKVILDFYLTDNKDWYFIRGLRFSRRILRVPLKGGTASQTRISPGCDPCCELQTWEGRGAHILQKMRKEWRKNEVRSWRDRRRSPDRDSSSLSLRKRHDPNPQHLRSCPQNRHTYFKTGHLLSFNTTLWSHPFSWPVEVSTRIGNSGSRWILLMDPSRLQVLKVVKVLKP